MQINTEMTMLITHVIKMQEVECLKTYFLLSFFTAKYCEKCCS